MTVMRASEGREVLDALCETRTAAVRYLQQLRTVSERLEAEIHGDRPPRPATIEAALTLSELGEGLSGAGD